MVDHRGGLLAAINAAAKAAQLESDEYDFEITPGPANAFALPRTPFGFFEADTLGMASVFKALPIIFDPLIKAWSQPILRFQAGTPLALLPWTVEDNSTHGLSKDHQRLKR